MQRKELKVEPSGKTVPSHTPCREEGTLNKGQHLLKLCHYWFCDEHPIYQSIIDCTGSCEGGDKVEARTICD